MTTLDEPITNERALSASRPCVRTPPCVEPTLGELLSDPLILAVMRADGIDAVAVKQVMTSAARRLGKVEFHAGESKFDPLTARYFPTPLRVNVNGGVGADATNASVIGKGAKSACGTLCPW